MATASALVVDVHRVNRIPFDAAWKWLAAGSRESRNALQYDAPIPALAPRALVEPLGDMRP